MVCEESKGVYLYVEVIFPVNRMRGCCSLMVKDANEVGWSRTGYIIQPYAGKRYGRDLELYMAASSNCQVVDTVLFYSYAAGDTWGQYLEFSA